MGGRVWEQAHRLYEKGYPTVMLMADGVSLTRLASERVARFREAYPEGQPCLRVQCACLASDPPLLFASHYSCYNPPDLFRNFGGRAVTSGACVFCDIVRGTAPASIVYADDGVMAFMDIQPVNRGHLLVVPRSHAASLTELDGETGGRLFQVAMKLAEAVRRSGVRCEGVNLFLADGEAAGQEIMHVHLHVIPRYRGDGFGVRFAPEYYRLPERVRLDELAADIRQALEG